MDSILIPDPLIFFICLIISFAVYNLAQFYMKVISLPPGPIPVPILGNLLGLLELQHGSIAMERLLNDYESLATVWLGPFPFIFIKDIELGRQLFQNHDFAGRPQILEFTKEASNEKFSNVILDDYGKRWETLRRLGHSIIFKYAITDKLMYLSSDCVDRIIQLMIEKEGFGKAFIPLDYIHYLFFNIQAMSAFDKRFEMDQGVYKDFKFILDDNLGALAFYLLKYIPVLRLIKWKSANEWLKTPKDTIDLIRNEFSSHYSDYDESVVRGFCDTLITAKNEALRENKDSAPYLTDDNLTMILYDMLLAGTFTSKGTFQWILLFLLYFPEMQTKLRQEIESEIGDRIPTHEDRSRCHYVMAFLSESLRFRSVAPYGIPRLAVVDSTIGQYTIPKGTGVFLFQKSIMNNEKYWKDPDQFIPERFLTDGQYVTTRPKAFIPFGVGRRVCLGEKLAIAQLFLVLVRFLQKTSDYELILETDNGLDPYYFSTFLAFPKEFKISFNKKQ